MFRTAGVSLLHLLIGCALVGAMVFYILGMSSSKGLQDKTNQLLSAANPAKAHIISALTMDFMQPGCIMYPSYSRVFTTPQTSLVQGIDVITGVIVITGEPSELQGENIVLYIYPVVDIYGQVVWHCQADDMFHEYVPLSCRNPVNLPSNICRR